VQGTGVKREQDTAEQVSVSAREKRVHRLLADRLCDVGLRQGGPVIKEAAGG
jgi:hypothetical protein